MFSKLTVKKSKRFVFVLVSDTHAGHNYGLLNPDTIFKEYDYEGSQYDHKPSLNKQQEYLWDTYIESVERVREIAKGAPIIVLHNGDLTAGLKYPNQMAFTAISNQIIAARDNMLPWLKLPNMRAFRITYGTQSHEFFEGTAPRLVIDSLEERYPDKDVRLMKHGYTEIEGVTFNYAHHGPYPGSRKWLEGNVARYYLRDLMMRSILSGKAPPYINAYAHYHTPIEEKLTMPANGNIYRSYLFISPSFELLGDYGQQATRSIDKVTNGVIALECDQGGLVNEPHWITKTTDIRTKEVIEL